jgi:hypothetical protein
MLREEIQLLPWGEEQILKKVLTKIFVHEKCERGMKKKV